MYKSLRLNLSKQSPLKTTEKLGNVGVSRSLCWKYLPYFFIVFTLNIFSMPLYAETLKTYDINFYNVAVKGIEPQELNLKWKFFLLDNDQVLFNKPTDKHRNDQFCSYTFDIDETGRVIESSIKLVEHRKNYAYNLKAFEFLKDFDFELKTVKFEKTKKQKNTGTNPRADFIYLAY
ncbi:MAG: hypothetical protein VKK32_05015 [Candidatus Melainabacteria bacterium]|nr:hypothetical protein [Candidatus Melainabacteria bacterium]